MGSGHSVTLEPYTLLRVKPIRLPIPDEIGRPIIAWYRRNYSDDVNGHVAKFREFINSPNRVTALILDSAQNPTRFFDGVLGMFYATSPFRSFLYNGKPPDTVPIIGIRDGVVAGVKRIDVASLWESMKAGKDYSAIFSILVLSSTQPGGHSNTGLLRYDGAEHTLRFYLFEPHYPMNKPQIDARVEGLRAFIETRLSGGVDTQVRAIGANISPLQTTTDNCAQWSLLMCLFYVMNTPTTTRVSELFDTLAQYRTLVMPMWLYFLYTARDQESLREFGSPPRAARQRSRTTDLDVFECHARTPDECVHPCSLQSDGTCINAELFRE